MHKTSKPRLTLSRETLRALTTTNLRRVAGGEQQSVGDISGCKTQCDSDIQSECFDCPITPPRTAVCTTRKL